MPIFLHAGPLFAGALQVSPWIEYGLDYDSNLFSASQGSKPADIVQHGIIGVLAGWQFARQKFVGRAQASRYRYRRFGALDHDEHQARAAWQFKFWSLLSGAASYSDERYLENFANRSSRRPDFINRREPQFDGYLEITPDWRTHAGAYYLRYAHSLASRRRFDRHETQGLLALQYTGEPDSLVGAGAEIIEGKYPGRHAGDPLPRSFVQGTGFFHADWKYSGVSRFQARVGYTRRNNSGGGNRDFSGVTGRLAYIRTISANTQVSTELFRRIYSVDEVDANYLRTTGAQVTLAWTYSPILDLNAHIDYRRQDYQVLAGAAARRDDLYDIAAKLTYQIYRGVALIFNASAIKRHSNQADESYNEYLGGLALRLTLNPPPS